MISKEKIRQIWDEKDPVVKKNMCIDIIKNFDHKKKQRQFMVDANNPKTDLNKLATNLMLAAEGLAVL
jgi:hypothetical protein